MWNIKYNRDPNFDTILPPGGRYIPLKSSEIDYNCRKHTSIGLFEILYTFPFKNKQK